MSQVANTFWDDRIETFGATAREKAVARRRARSRRLIDSVIIAIILAAFATCVSVYSRARTELAGALLKHAAASDKLSDLTVRVQKMEREVQQLRTDPKVIELFARQRFGFVRSGDIVIKVVQESDSKSNRESNTASITTQRQTAEHKNSETEFIKRLPAGRQTEPNPFVRRGAESNTAVKQNAERQTAQGPGTDGLTGVRKTVRESVTEQ